MRNQRFIWLVLLLTFWLPGLGFSQVDALAGDSTATEPDSTRPKIVEIKNADIFESKRVGKAQRPIRKLVGNVHFVHDSTDMFCDSAYQFLDSSYIEAYSNVRIISQRSDSMRIRSEKLVYYSATRVLHLEDSIFFTDDAVSLETQKLTYFREKNYGEYFEGGILKDSANTLTSERGYYYQDENRALFKQNVKLVNPDYTLETDTLAYDTQKDIVYFHAPTLIYDEKSELYTENGWYDTANEIAYLYENAYAQDTVNRLSADTIYYNHAADSGWARTSVKLRDLDKELYVYGEYGEFRQNPNKTYVADSAYAINYMDGDTLFLFGDTLYAEQDSNEKRQQIRAYPNVRIFMTGMQAIADSLVYLQDDSLMSFFDDPVLWSDRNQLSGDTIRIYFRGDFVDSMSVGKKSFMIMKEDTVGFSQVKSKYMQAKFKDNDLVRMENSGNVESVFFSEDDKGGYMGVNTAKCTDMTVRFKENKPVRINFKENPEGKFKPIHEVLFKDNNLEGFDWREDERPEKPWHLLPDSVRPKPDTLLQDSLKATLDSLLNDSLRMDSLRADSLAKDSLITAPDSLLDSTLVQVKDSLGQVLDSLGNPIDTTGIDSTLKGKALLKGKGSLSAADSTIQDSTQKVKNPNRFGKRIRLAWRYLTGKAERPPKEERAAARAERNKKWKEESKELKAARKAERLEVVEARKKAKLERMIARKIRRLEKRAQRRKRKKP